MCSLRAELVSVHPALLLNVCAASRKFSTGSKENTLLSPLQRDSGHVTGGEECVHPSRARLRVPQPLPQAGSPLVCGPWVPWAEGGLVPQAVPLGSLLLSSQKSCETLGCPRHSHSSRI